MTGLAGEQCTATAKGSRQRCKRLVIGGGVCPMHGGSAPQVRAAREARIVTAEAMKEAPRTAAEAADVLLGAMNDSHSVLQRLKGNIASGQVSAADLDALGAWVDRASRTAKLVVDTGLEERKVRISESQGRILALIVERILCDMLASVIEVLGNDSFNADRVRARWRPAITEIVPRRFREAAELEGDA